MDRETALTLINEAWDRIRQLSEAHQAGEFPCIVLDSADYEDAHGSICGDLAPLLFIHQQEIPLNAYGEFQDRLIKEQGLEAPDDEG